MLPIAAVVLSTTMSSWAQTAATTTAEKTLAPVVVKEKALAPEGKDALRATQTGIGKGKQELRDIPQSITVVTEKLIDDRNLDTLKEALHNTAGITFLAAEGGEEDIRLRGFSLAATGDIFVDGMRDPAFYDRDTFNNDRIELLRGSASMLFGRGSTGGAVNQVSKQPRLIDENSVDVTVGSHNYKRAVGDFNIQTGENAALRITAMATKADNNGSGSSIDKRGVAGTYRWGIGTADEFSVGLYYLDNKNGMNYGLPWIRANGADISTTGLMSSVDPSAYYGMASDHNNGGAKSATVSHTHRFDDGGELKTMVRHGSYERDQRASTIRRQPTNKDGTSCSAAFVAGSTTTRQTALFNTLSDAQVLCRGTNNKIQDMQTTYLQSDYSKKFEALGVKHEVLTGIDYAHEKFVNYNATGTLVKATTTVGTPNDGASVNEDLRALSVGRTFDATAVGLYVQDMVQVAPQWKVLGGLRVDNFKGKYNAATATATAAAYNERSDTLLSKRLGVLYQPTDTSSFHFSYGTSFNTSGDTYQYDNQTANTKPEGSVNYELGAKLDSADKRFTTRLALFYAIKNNERNRDPDSAATQALLSGKRHAAGFEIDATGKLTKEWEVYGSYAFTPIARIDVGAPGSVAGVAEGEGTRSSLTPKHSGTVWTTYQITPQFRVGAGVNFRSEQTPNRNPGWAASSFVTGDLMAEYTFDRYTLKANVSNVTNKLYADALYTGHYIPGAGRVYALTASVKF
ncbi:MAG: TonB-dependent siderophore receptor [Burkholderiaceae bacterium]|nr:TonB-dependent siderophore receptor [Burkholderiaceae bacterium]